MKKLIILLTLLITLLVNLNSFENIVLPDKPNAIWIKQTPEQSWEEYKKIVAEYNKVVTLYAQLSQKYNDVSLDYGVVSKNYDTLSLTFDTQSQDFDNYKLLVKPIKWGFSVYVLGGVDIKLGVLAGIGNDFSLYFWGARIELILGYYVKLYDNVGGGLKIGFAVNFK